MSRQINFKSKEHPKADKSGKRSQTNENLSQLIENAGDGIVGISGNGIVTLWNKGAEEIFGYTKNEAIGQKIDIVIPQNKKHEEATGESNTFPEIVGNGKSLMPVFDMMAKVAKTDATILIQGESGTGKELVAKAIHDKSPRGGHAFIPINCGAIPESLLESELFGHEKGAFTGAVLRKHGLFEIANKGTIFLDEVGEMGLFLQVKLLRVLETGIFRRIGDTRDINVDVRIIAASNKDLRESVEKKEFREDIYYRLNVFPIDLPPLRERKEDIPLLIQWFLKKHKLSEKNVNVSERVSKVLWNYNWPGNVRELENVIQRAGILSLGKTIKEEHLPLEIRCHDDSMLCGNGIYDKTFRDSKAEFEKTYLERLLERTSHDITKASRFAGLTRAYIYEMIKKHNMDYKKNIKSNEKGKLDYT